MANKLGIEINATENVSEKMKDVKKSFQDTAQSAQQLDKVKQRLENITNSTMPAKRQLRELQVIMTNMNLDGLSNTDVFTEVAQRAGNLRDAMDDSRQAIAAYADDQFKIKAMGEAFEGITAVMSVATSASALFGAKNEDVQRALLKVQAAMGLVNGVQKIANLLNKDSALMLRIKQIRLAANVTTTNQETAALTANTVAGKINNTVTAVGTVKQNAWNVAKAVAKALLGDWTGLLLVGATALGAYALATQDSTDKLEEQTNATKQIKEATQDYSKTTQDTYANLMTSYTKLKNSWNQLKTEHEKNEWIKNNATELNNLELSIVDVESAERAFNGNTDAVVQSFINRAKAAAKLAEMVDEYRKQMKLIDEISDIQTTIKTDAEKTGRSKYKVGDKVTDPNDRNSRYAELRGNDWFYTQKGIDRINGAKNSTNPTLQRKQAELDASVAKTDRLAAEIANDAKQVKKIVTNTTNKSNKKDTTTKKDEKTPAGGSIESMSRELRDLQESLQYGLVPKDKIEETKERIIKLKKDIDTQQIELGFKDDPNIAKQKAIQNTVDKLNEEFGKIKFDFKNPIQGSYDKAVGKELNYEQQLNYYDRIKDRLEQLIQKYKEEKQEGTEAFSQIGDELEKVNEKIKKTSDTAQEWNEKIKKIESARETLGSIGDTAGAVGNTFSTLGNVFAQTGDDATAAAMTVIGSVADMISQVIPQIMALIGVKEGEAMAAGTASAAALPFPANIGAIATIIGTVISTFATIASVVGSFAEGGVVGGNSYYGDKLYARVNSGETILNTKQAKTALEMMDNGGTRITTTVVTGDVKVKGSDLYIALKNLNGVKKGVGKNIGIK